MLFQRRPMAGHWLDQWRLRALGCSARETEALRHVATLVDRSVPYYSIYFSTDGNQLITSSGGSEAAITLWDLATQLELIRLTGKASGYHHGEFSPDGNVLAALSYSGE